MDYSNRDMDDINKMNNNYKLTKFLLREGANPNIWSGGYGFNDSYLPLHQAVKKNNLNLLVSIVSIVIIY